MSHRHPQPTLLVFTLGADAESRRHRLLPEPCRPREVDLRRQCLERVLAAGRGAGCRLEISSPGPLDDLLDDLLDDPLGGTSDEPGAGARDLRHLPQRGDSFGTRLDGALNDCLRRRRGPVVVVGTDVPDLSARHLERALDALGDDPDRVVVGPSPDGGFYLLATHRPIGGLASAVSWCCAATLQTLLDTLAAAGRPVVLLEALADLDRRTDLERWLAARDGVHDEGWSAVVASLRSLLAALRRPLVHRHIPAPRPGLALAAPGRSPPLSTTL